MLYVVKRDGREVKFNSEKIANAIKRSSQELGKEFKLSEILEITQKVICYIEETQKEKISVEEIQNFVEKGLKDTGYRDIAVNYANYRNERTRVREIKSDLMKAIGKIGVETDRDNANVGNNFSSKLWLILINPLEKCGIQSNIKTKIKN